MTKTTTHVRIEKKVLKDIKRDFPDMRTSEVIKMYKTTYDGLQKAGRMIYGNIWKTKKK